MSHQTDALTIGEILRINDRLRRDVEEALSRLDRPGKRMSGVERDERRGAVNDAKRAFESFRLRFDPDFLTRGQQMARDVENENQALIERLHS